MVQLANSEQLAVRYAPYIQELREFFALHDVLCGAPRELGFFAARLSGRDTFPDELASMVRSFIFREGGAFPLTDLRTVVAIAVGGSAVAQSAGELQHPLHDLTTFLAAVARSPLDQPPPTPRPGEADVRAETLRTETVPAAATPLPPSFDDTAEPSDDNDPFRPPLASGAGLTPSPFAARSKQIGLAALPAPVRSRRALWAGLAVGLPLVLLFAFLYFQPTQTTPSPDAGPAPSGPPASSLSAPQAAAPPTPLSAAAEALAHPTSANTAHPGVSSPPLLGQPRPPATGQATPSAASPSPNAPSQPPAVPAATPSPSPASTTAAVEPANRAPSPPPATASSPKSPPSSTSHAAPANPSVATVTAQQGAFGVSSGIMSSHLVSFSPPKYPAMAGFTHAQGQVILQAVVSKTGRVSAVKAITGPRTLRKAAETAVRQWRYRPYIVDGHAADVATIITIDVKSPHP